MDQVIFVDRTTSNGRATVYSSIELPLRWYAKNVIHIQAGVIYKGLTKYHPTVNELKKLEEKHSLVTMSVGHFVV